MALVVEAAKTYVRALGSSPFAGDLFRKFGSDESAEAKLKVILNTFGVPEHLSISCLILFRWRNRTIHAAKASLSKDERDTMLIPTCRVHGKVLGSKRRKAYARF